MAHRQRYNLHPLGHALMWLLVTCVAWWIGNQVKKDVGGAGGVIAGMATSYLISNAIEH